MADRNQLINALKKADAAGDVEAAKAIARRIKSMEQPQEVAAPVEQPIQPQPKQDVNTLLDMVKGAARGIPSGLAALPNLVMDAAMYPGRKLYEAQTGKDLSDRKSVV